MAEATAAPVEETFNVRDFRDTLGSFATGVTVITTQGPDEPYGMTANAFSSVSLDPPLVLICVIRGTQGEEMIESNRIFAVNILAQEQEAISRYFASKTRPRGPDAFREISHRRAASGAPILDDSAAYLDCRVVASHEAGDHMIFIGEVMAIGSNPEARPLLFHRGKYGYLDAG